MKHQVIICITIFLGLVIQEVKSATCGAIKEAYQVEECCDDSDSKHTKFDLASAATPNWVSSDSSFSRIGCFAETLTLHSSIPAEENNGENALTFHFHGVPGSKDSAEHACSQHCIGYQYFSITHQNEYKCSCYWVMAARKHRNMASMSPFTECNANELKDGSHTLFVKYHQGEDCTNANAASVVNRLLRLGENKPPPGWDHINEKPTPLSPFQLIQTGCGTNMYNVVSYDSSDGNGETTTVDTKDSFASKKEKGHDNQDESNWGVAGSITFRGVTLSGGYDSSESSTETSKSVFGSSNSAESEIASVHTYALSSTAYVRIRDFKKEHHFVTFSKAFYRELLNYKNSKYSDGIGVRILAKYGAYFITQAMYGGWMETESASSMQKVDFKGTSENNLKSCITNTEGHKKGIEFMGVKLGRDKTETSNECQTTDTDSMEKDVQEFTDKSETQEAVGMQGSLKMGELNPQHAVLITDLRKYDEQTIASHFRYRHLADALNPAKIHPTMFRDPRMYGLSEDDFDSLRSQIGNLVLRIKNNNRQRLNDRNMRQIGGCYISAFTPKQRHIRELSTVSLTPDSADYVSEIIPSSSEQMFPFLIKSNMVTQDYETACQVRLPAGYKGPYSISWCNSNGYEWQHPENWAASTMESDIHLYCARISLGQCTSRYNFFCGASTVCETSYGTSGFTESGHFCTAHADFQNKDGKHAVFGDSGKNFYDKRVYDDNVAMRHDLDYYPTRKVINPDTGIIEDPPPLAPQDPPRFREYSSGHSCEDIGCKTIDNDNDCLAANIALWPSSGQRMSRSLSSIKNYPDFQEYIESDNYPDKHQGSYLVNTFDALFSLRENVHNCGHNGVSGCVKHEAVRKNNLNEKAPAFLRKNNLIFTDLPSAPFEPFAPATCKEGDGKFPVHDIPCNTPDGFLEYIVPSNALFTRDVSGNIDGGLSGKHFKGQYYWYPLDIYNPQNTTETYITKSYWEKNGYDLKYPDGTDRSRGVYMRARYRKPERNQALSPADIFHKEFFTNMNLRPQGCSRTINNQYNIWDNTYKNETVKWGYTTFRNDGTIIDKQTKNPVNRGSCFRINSDAPYERDIATDGRWSDWEIDGNYTDMRWRDQELLSKVNSEHDHTKCLCDCKPKPKPEETHLPVFEFVDPAAMQANTSDHRNVAAAERNSLMNTTKLNAADIALRTCAAITHQNIPYNESNHAQWSKTGNENIKTAIDPSSLLRCRPAATSVECDEAVIQLVNGAYKHALNFKLDTTVLTPRFIYQQLPFYDNLYDPYLEYKNLKTDKSPSRYQSLWRLHKTKHYKLPGCSFSGINPDAGAGNGDPPTIDIDIHFNTNGYGTECPECRDGSTWNECNCRTSRHHLKRSDTEECLQLCFKEEPTETECDCLMPRPLGGLTRRALFNPNIMRLRDAKKSRAAERQAEYNDPDWKPPPPPLPAPYTDIMYKHFRACVCETTPPRVFQVHEEGSKCDAEVKIRNGLVPPGTCSSIGDEAQCLAGFNSIYPTKKVTAASPNIYMPLGCNFNEDSSGTITLAFNSINNEVDSVGGPAEFKNLKPQPICICQLS